jgi:hypothetical protein
MLMANRQFTVLAFLAYLAYSNIGGSSFSRNIGLSAA